MRSSTVCVWPLLWPLRGCLRVFIFEDVGRPCSRRDARIERDNAVGAGLAPGPARSAGAEPCVADAPVVGTSMRRCICRGHPVSAFNTRLGWMVINDVWKSPAHWMRSPSHPLWVAMGAIRAQRTSHNGPLIEGHEMCAQSPTNSLGACASTTKNSGHEVIERRSIQEWQDCMKHMRLL